MALVLFILLLLIVFIVGSRIIVRLTFFFVDKILFGSWKDKDHRF